MKYIKYQDKIYTVKEEVDKTFELKKLQKKLSNIDKAKQIAINEITIEFNNKKKLLQQHIKEIKELKNNLK